MRAQTKKQIMAMLMILAAMLMIMLPTMGSYAEAEESTPQYGYISSEGVAKVNESFLSLHVKTKQAEVSTDAPAITVLTHGWGGNGFLK